TNRALKGSQTPFQTVKHLVSAFYGWQKIFKKLLETSKICEFPSREPQNRVERRLKPSSTKTNQENPEPEGSRTIQEEPLLTEGLCI
ncbi:MAG: hypothetical protein KHZ68_03805, partial [Rothia mucilaginosa]|uniref:hypothetical protein n=1 Tax=Rothia mucilaginosa TaxID=43675 RepID=UPI0026E96824